MHNSFPWLVPGQALGQALGTEAPARARRRRHAVRSPRMSRSRDVPARCGRGQICRLGSLEPPATDAHWRPRWRRRRAVLDHTGAQQT